MYKKGIEFSSTLWKIKRNSGCLKEKEANITYKKFLGKEYEINFFFILDKSITIS